MIELEYVTYEKWLPEKSEVTFYLTSHNIHYKVEQGVGWYLRNRNVDNDEIFNELDITDTKGFVHAITGPCYDGVFPEVLTVGDLENLIIALNKECIKKFGPKSKNICGKQISDEGKFNIGDTVEILPREGSDFNYSPRYVDSMMEYAGKIARITNHIANGYLLDIDEGYWYWPAEALKKVEDKKFKDGDYVCVPREDYIAIFKDFKDGKLYRHACCYKNVDKTFTKYGYLFCDYSDIRLATQDEVDILNSKLNKAGLVWNPCEKKVINCLAKAIEISTESKTNLLETEASNAHPVKEINYFQTKKHYKFKFNL